MKKNFGYWELTHFSCIQNWIDLVCTVFRLYPTLLSIFCKDYSTLSDLSYHFDESDNNDANQYFIVSFSQRSTEYKKQIRSEYMHSYKDHWARSSSVATKPYYYHNTLGQLYTVRIWGYEKAKNPYRDLTPFFIPPRYVDHKNMNEKNIPRWLFELPPR